MSFGVGHAGIVCALLPQCCSISNTFRAGKGLPLVIPPTAAPGNDDDDNRYDDRQHHDSDNGDESQAENRGQLLRLPRPWLGWLVGSEGQAEICGQFFRGGFDANVLPMHETTHNGLRNSGFASDRVERLPGFTHSSTKWLGDWHGHLFLFWIDRRSRKV